jgi:hypothetical protein
MSKSILSTDGILLFWCPGCHEAHGVMVNGSRGWTWNGSTDAPALSPSILVRSSLYGPDKLGFTKYEGPHPCKTTPSVCHSFVKDGKIEFLGDCTHSLAGQTVDIPEWE